LKELERTSYNDPKVVSDAQNLVPTLENFEFLVSMVIWHDILFSINMVSKKLQSKIVCMDVALKQIQGVISFFKNYRNEGFTSSINIAKFIARDMGGIEPNFPTKCHAIRKNNLMKLQAMKMKRDNQPKSLSEFIIS
jgi:hypothetical protein